MVIPKNLIWDLDGTLIDSELSIALCLQNVLIRYGYKYSSGLNSSYRGLPLMDLIREVLPESASQKLIEEVASDFKSEYDIEYCTHAPIFPEILDFHNQFPTFQFMIATNKRRFPTQRIVKEVLESFNISQIVCCDDQGIFSKKDMIVKIINDQGWSSDSVVYIGDTDADAQSAHKASVDFLMVKWSSSQRSRSDIGLSYDSFLDSLRQKGFNI